MKKFEIYADVLVDDCGLALVDTIEAENEETAWGIGYSKVMKSSIYDSGSIEIYEVKELKELKVGDWFTFKPCMMPKESQVWVRDGYDRSSKKYGIHKWDDVCHESERKGSIKVYVDFIF